MRTIEAFRSSANESSVPAAFVNGYTDGQTARSRNASLTAYLRVGIDDYARGYRAGFFARSDRVPAEPVAIERQVVNL